VRKGVSIYHKHRSVAHPHSITRQLGRDFVMVVEGSAPLTSTGLYDGPRPVSDVHSYQTRYWGFAAAGELGVSVCGMMEGIWVG